MASQLAFSPIGKVFLKSNRSIAPPKSTSFIKVKKKITCKYFPDLGNFMYICTVRIITKKRLEDFAKQYPDAKSALKFWYDVVTANNFYSAQEVIQVFVRKPDIRRISLLMLPSMCVQFFPLRCFSESLCMYLSKVSGALTGNSLPVSLRC